MTEKRVRDQAKQEQTERFKETARELGCDEDEAAFKEKLGLIAKQRCPARNSRRPRKRAESK